jgi:hypothetical protein
MNMFTVHHGTLKIKPHVNDHGMIVFDSFSDVLLSVSFFTSAIAYSPNKLNGTHTHDNLSIPFLLLVTCGSWKYVTKATLSGHAVGISVNRRRTEAS